MSAARAHWVWLATRPNVRMQTLHALLRGLGTPSRIYAADRAEYRQAGCQHLEIEALCDKSLDGAYTILHDCTQKQIELLTMDDSGYPALLREIDDPPLVLYVRGRLPDLALAPAVTIVGTRRASAYGTRMAERFGAGLSQGGFTIVSGMALGIDAAAQRGCLRAGGRTIAVLAGGVDLCYPPSNRSLMQDILLEGAVISENPPGTPHAGFRFPIRNRLMCGLSMATLVVEAPARSGALITARRAFDQGREVFAVPGPLDTPTSEGCNALIRDELARLVMSPLDIAHALAGSLRTPLPVERIEAVWARETGGSSLPPPVPDETPAPPEPPQGLQIVTPPAARQAAPQALPDHLTDDERAVMQALQNGADTVDSVSHASGLPAARASAALVILELDGLVRLSGGRYQALD